MRPPRFRLRTLMAVVAILAVAMISLPVAWRELSLDWVDDAYALWGAGDMVVDYMEEHNGQWPKGWDDLRPYFAAGHGRVGGWSFEEYQRHVTIRWDVDPSALEGCGEYEPPAYFPGNRREGMVRRHDQRVRAQRNPLPLFPRKSPPLDSTLGPICLHYGLSDGHSYSHDEIGEQFGIAPESVAEIEQRSVEKLRSRTDSPEPW